VKISTVIALTFVTALSGSRSYAQTEQSIGRHHYHHAHPPHHAVHHHYVARGPTVSSERADAGIDRAPLPTNQIFKPYAEPGEGDSDGLSSDPDDCMKGCIGGNPQ
jgi:hypothetical protein